MDGNLVYALEFCGLVTKTVDLTKSFALTRSAFVVSYLYKTELYWIALVTTRTQRRCLLFKENHLHCSTLTVVYHVDFNWTNIPFGRL
jgi:hypothetical protein